MIEFKGFGVQWNGTGHDFGKAMKGVTLCAEYDQTEGEFQFLILSEGTFHTVPVKYVRIAGD